MKIPNTHDSTWIEAFSAKPVQCRICKFTVYHSFLLYHCKIQAQHLRTWPSTHQHCTTVSQMQGAVEDEAAEQQSIYNGDSVENPFNLQKIPSCWANFKRSKGTSLSSCLKLSWPEIGTKLISCNLALTICVGSFFLPVISPFKYPVVSLLCTWHYHGLT